MTHTPEKEEQRFLPEEKEMYTSEKFKEFVVSEGGGEVVEDMERLCSQSGVGDL